MFDNPGGKLKGFAIFIFALTVFAGVVLGVILSAKQESITFKALIVFISIASSIIVGWLGSIFIYAFGELCENVDWIANEYYDNNHKVQPKRKKSKMTIKPESRTNNDDETIPES